MSYRTDTVIDNRVFEELIPVLGIPGLDFPIANYCSSRNYRRWEQEIAEPRLRRLGYTILMWGTGERDSYGPLTRFAVVRDKNGTRRNLIYG